MKTTYPSRQKPPPSVNDRLRRRFHQAQERARSDHAAMCVRHGDDFGDCV